MMMYTSRPFLRFLRAHLLLLGLSLTLTGSAAINSEQPSPRNEASLFELYSGKVMFHSGTQIESFTGETTKVEGTLDAETGQFEFRVDMASVDTGNSRRDRNMREDYMETDTYPYVTYEGKVQQLPDPEEATEPQPVTSTGTFTIKDQTREVEIDGMMRYDKDAEAWHIEAGFEILLSDYNISRPRFLLIRMQEDQEIELSFELRPS